MTTSPVNRAIAQIISPKEEKAQELWAWLQDLFAAIRDELKDVCNTLQRKWSSPSKDLLPVSKDQIQKVLTHYSLQRIIIRDQLWKCQNEKEFIAELLAIDLAISCPSKSHKDLYDAVINTEKKLPNSSSLRDLVFQWKSTSLQYLDAQNTLKKLKSI